MVCNFCFFYLTGPPNITHTSGNQTVNESDTVSLTCTADGNPSPNITWTRLSANSVVTFPLTITGKQDEGYYRCTADNGVGSPGHRTIFIFVESELNDIFINLIISFLHHVMSSCRNSGGKLRNLLVTLGQSAESKVDH